MSAYNALVRCRGCLQLLRSVSVRHASLTSAIERGIRKSRSLESTSPAATSYSHRLGSRLRPPRSPPLRASKLEGRAGAANDGNAFPPPPRPPPRENSNKLSSKHPFHRKKNRKGPRRHAFSDDAPEQVKAFVKSPSSMPLTHPASEFVYGTNAVEAALRCDRRQLYKLYIYQAADEKLNFAKVALRKLALAKGLPVKMAFGDWSRLFDKVADGRPHNGCVLEASRLPLLPVRSLQSYHPSGADASDAPECFRVELAPQSREEAAVNGTKSEIPILHSHLRKQNRYPVVLLLDGILDPGNLGAIVRSAYYLGIDAVVFAGRNSAPLTPVAIKSSAGAAENMTLLEVGNEVDFIKRSKANGWRFYAADAPGMGSTYVDPAAASESSSSGGGGGGGDSGSPLTQSPSVLMLGSEGTGLSSHIRNQADSIVSIPRVRDPVPGISSDPARIDSLNVSVAAALLMEKFLLVPVELSSAIPRMPLENREKQKGRRSGKGGARGKT